MSILYGATCIIGILCMITIMFIGIWLFITALKAFEQLKYKNYILEKIYQKLDSTAYTKYDEEDFNELDSFFDVNNNDNMPKVDNIKNFDAK